MNILVTGGAGYIGTELVPKLAQLPEVNSITVYDNLSRGNYNFFLGKSYNTDKIKFVDGDILDSRQLRKVLKGIDVVYHLAAKVTTPFSNFDSHFFEQINHWGTAELVYAIEESNIQKLIFMSSASVYGNTTKEVNEDTVPNPSSFYGISKLRGEDHVKRLFDKVPTNIIRCGNVYGYSKSMRFDAVINRFIFDANFNHRVSVHGNGRQYRPFISVDKATDVITQLLKTPVPSGIYNLTDRNLSILDLIDELKIIYPNLEYLFVNPQLQIQELRMAQSKKLAQYIPLPATNLHDELNHFREQFSFYSNH
jgi:UDP-glucose 4-epimerase